jgi:hypothetical protein
VSERPSPLRVARMFAMRASISLDHSRCFARASWTFIRPVFNRSSVRCPYSFAYSLRTSNGISLRAMKPG